MSRLKELFPIFFGILLGLSVLASQSGLFNYFDSYTFYSTLNYISQTLYFVAGYLAWRISKREDNLFFKWLAIAFALMVGLWIEGLLVKKLSIPMTISDSKNIYLLFMRTNMLFLHAGSILAVMLTIFAIYNFRSKVIFSTVFKPAVLVLIALAFFLGTVLPSLIPQFIMEKPTFTYFYIINLALTMFLYTYGLRISIISQKNFNIPMFKILSLYFALNLTEIILGSISNLLRTDFLRFFASISIYLKLVKPILLVIGLTTYDPPGSTPEE